MSDTILETNGLTKYYGKSRGVEVREKIGYIPSEINYYSRNNAKNY